MAVVEQADRALGVVEGRAVAVAVDPVLELVRRITHPEGQREQLMEETALEGALEDADQNKGSDMAEEEAVAEAAAKVAGEVTEQQADSVVVVVVR